MSDAVEPGVTFPAGRGKGDRLNHVGMERALRQELRAADLLGLGFEYVDEQRADRLALFSGSVVLASALHQHGDDAGVHAS